MARAGAGRVADDDYVDERPGIGAFIFSMLRESPRDSFAAVVAAGATGAILINALFLQSGPHPAPIFANKPAVIVANPAPAPVLAAAPSVGVVLDGGGALRFGRTYLRVRGGQCRDGLGAADIAAAAQQSRRGWSSTQTVWRACFLQNCRTRYFPLSARRIARLAQGGL